MATNTSEIEAAEKAVERIVDLLTQADQGLNEAKTLIDSFYAGAPHVTRSDRVAEAIRSVDTVLGQMVSQHNILVGELKAFREEAAVSAVDPTDPGY